MEKIRDRFWLWGHEAGSHDQEWNLPRSSRITPVEAATYMGIPNMILVRYNGRPAPPFDQYAIPFRALKRVVWSIVGAAGATGEEERTEVLKLAARLPNMTGVMMDDFFKEPTEGGEIGALSLEELRDVRSQFVVAGRRLDLWVVLYDHQLGWPVRDYLALCDVVTFWTWNAPNLIHLERNFAAVEELAPSCRKVLGCYMWNYGDKGPMPLALMERQCQIGLQWLRERRIEGMIFLASCICDLELQAVEWTRRWIATVGDAELTAKEGG